MEEKKYCVYLRAFESGDYKIINKWRNNQQLYSKTVGMFRYVSSEMEKAWVESKMMSNAKDAYFAICLNDGSDKMVGYTSINDIDHINRKAHGGGIVIDPEYQSGDVLIDTNLLGFHHVFDNLGMHRYTGSCLECHTDSRIMMEMMGYKLEGIERESQYKFHKYNNLCKYSLLDSEYYELLNSGGYSELSIAKRVRALRKKY